MPPTVSVAAFVFGIVLLLAALIGKDLKVVTVELPALGPGRRIVLGLLGLALTLFGLFDGQAPGWPATAPTLETPATQPVASAASAAAPTREGVLPCLADVAGDDLVILPMDPARRTDRMWSSGQPRAGLLAMQFEDAAGGILGAVKFETLESAAGIDIVGVYDAACQPLATYANVSNPSQPKDHPYNFETMRYQIGDFIYAGDISYTEGGARIAVRIQQTAP